MTSVERCLAGEIAAETILKQAIEDAELSPCPDDPSFDLYDYLIIDCPPSVGMLTINALVAVTEIIVPVQAQVLALNGVANLRRVIGVIQSRLNPDLSVTGLLLCMTDKRTKLSREVEESARRHFPDLVFKSSIRDSVRAARFWASVAPVVLDVREEPTTHMRFDAGGFAVGLSESIALESPSLCFKCHDKEALLAVIEKYGLEHEKFPGYEGAFVVIKAPEGTTLFAFDEDFLGEKYEVDESDDPAIYPE